MSTSSHNNTTPAPETSDPSNKLLFNGADWDFDTLKNTYDAIEDIALNELKLDVYANQVEVITSEQMLDAYSSIGMPLMYHHWSFGKRFVRDDVMYRKGYQGLAYEIVINSNPCISYVMEENTIVMQALVMAHAAFGHNHFFKTTICSNNGPMPMAFLIICNLPNAISPSARIAMALTRLNGFSMPRTP